MTDKLTHKVYAEDVYQRLLAIIDKCHKDLKETDSHLDPSAVAYLDGRLECAMDLADALWGYCAPRYKIPEAE